MRNSANTKTIGDDGEKRAVEMYAGLGFTIVGRNFRTRRGEIDIIASKEEAEKGESLLVFAEVKALPAGNIEILGQELGRIKQKRIVETAKYFVQKHRKYSNSIIRFDAVVIDFPGRSPVYLIENAFTEN